MGALLSINDFDVDIIEQVTQSGLTRKPDEHIDENGGKWAYKNTCSDWTQCSITISTCIGTYKIDPILSEVNSALVYKDEAPNTKELFCVTYFDDIWEVFVPSEGYRRVAVIEKVRSGPFESSYNVHSTINGDVIFTVSSMNGFCSRQFALFKLPSGEVFAKASNGILTVAGGTDAAMIIAFMATSVIPEAKLR